MVHSSLIACIKMGVSLTNPKQQAAIHTIFWTHKNTAHAAINLASVDVKQHEIKMLSMGSTALSAAVVLPRYGGLN